MKTALRISIWLNLGLLAGLFFVLLGSRKQEATIPGWPKVKLPVQAAATPVPSPPPEAETQSFRWSQLMSAKDYRVYIANLRAIGCPAATIEDIVRGDTDRAFSWERDQLRLNGSGPGPWSRSQEMQLVASLLGGQSVETAAGVQGAENPVREDNGSATAQVPEPSQSAGAGTSHYPLFLQNVNWSTAGFDASQQAAIIRVRQQFLSEVNNPNQNSGDSTGQHPGSATPDAISKSADANDSKTLNQWQNALQGADNQLRDLLGAQGYAGYEQQQYYAWYQPQVVAASAGGGNLTINPGAFSSK
jgi:hypothetical protein